MLSRDSDKKFLHDPEFGDIELRRVRGSFVRLKIETDGRVVAQLPKYGGRLKDVEKLLNENREKLRKNFAKSAATKIYADGDKIGKSHILHLKNGARNDISLKNLDINVTIKTGILEREKQQLIRDAVAKALRIEAKAYLPRRLKYLSLQTGLKYQRVQFVHAKSRWGSCSNSGTISLNIALMITPNELIDYVLLHELNHTRHMDHSREFWLDLEKICPHAKRKKQWLKQFSPFL